jgi:hypothetical protein
VCAQFCLNLNSNIPILFPYLSFRRVGGIWGRITLVAIEAQALRLEPQ